MKLGYGGRVCVLNKKTFEIIRPKVGDSPQRTRRNIMINKVKRNFLCALVKRHKKGLILL